MRFPSAATPSSGYGRSKSEMMITLRFSKCAKLTTGEKTMWKMNNVTAARVKKMMHIYPAGSSTGRFLSVGKINSWE